MIKAKLLQNHKNECVYIRNPVQNPMFWYLNTYDGLRHTYLDAAGGRRGKNYRWIEVICPDTKCSARAIVRVDTIEEAIKQALEKG
ncbi:MAG: hypothetical protein WBV94_25100 [Blastocatellia bacterium]